MDRLISSSLPSSSKSSHKQAHQKRSNNHEVDASLHSILPRTQLPSSLHLSLDSDPPPTASSNPQRSANASSRSNITDHSHQSRKESVKKATPNAAVPPHIARIPDKKLRARVYKQDLSAKVARKERQEVDEWINAPLAGGAGGIEVDEEEGERTWRVGQGEIVQEVGVQSGRKRWDLKLEGMGEYKVDYTRNGRHLAIASSLGHVATFDWQSGKLHSEIQLRESVRDIKFLHSEAFYAVAQRKYVYIYDQDGVEVHKLKQHTDPTHLEFLPYHYLLVSVGHAGYLKYHDTSTGILLTQISTRLGSPPSITQNRQSAIIHLGHSNGTMTLWSPNLTTPHVKLLAHRGPITSIAVDPSASSAGRYISTSGLDGEVKLWDARMWGKQVRSWKMHNSPTSLSYSDRGVLAVGGKSGVTTFRDVIAEGNRPYLTLPLPSLTANSVRFCPFDDVLVVGHQKGVSSLLVPGAGEPNFDSAEADVFETYTRRREREVRGVLEKIRPELITLDTEFLGKVRDEKKGTFAEREARSFRQLSRRERLKLEGKADEDEGQVEEDDEMEDEDDGEEGGGSGSEGKERKKKKMRGKGGSMKRYLAKKRKNVIDPSLLAMRAKVAAQKQVEESKKRSASKETGALSRFG
ncbi:U3 small nucleolar RNA-associated protein 7 [Tremella mesenterica]|uniref:U three protein 7 n=1 Tax=Tremella mesenterica TaxID=5217 RepID=A0A4Q1BPW1_TREME|nr:uncharacterized protein TREMEDRAFT_29850 [Tremella mesenterica DSM 1558]EIW70250.1 hypothetical protein TREMEDRAFT_29850 [Tremella mesenterica DSM 1558]RXK39961.1 U3 small nucleolar RNA-associated protein 7 [Tremella mesenterica]